MGLETILGGIALRKQAKGEKEAQKDNYNRFLADRKLLMDEFEKSRGSDGSAFLGNYFGTGENAFEQQAANDYRGLYNATAVDPAEQLARYGAVQTAFMPMMEAGRGALGGVFDGTYGEGRLNNARPVFQARQDLARTQKQGILQGLQERINALNSGNAAKGFSGTGSFAQNRLLGSTIGARQAAAGIGAQANLANATDEQGIRDYAMNLKLSNLQTPYQLAGAQTAFMDMPQQQVIQSYLNRLAPMERFRIGTAMPNIPMTPGMNYVPSSSQIFWQTAAENVKQDKEMAMGAAGMMFGGGMGGMLGGGGGGGGAPAGFSPYVAPQAAPNYKFSLYP